MWKQLYLGERGVSYLIFYLGLYLIYYYPNNLLTVYCMTVNVGHLELGLRYNIWKENNWHLKYSSSSK